MRELLSAELNQVSGSGLNVGIYFDVPYYPQPNYYTPVYYEPVYVPYTMVTPIYNPWGYQVGYEVEEGFYEVWEPVVYYW